MAEDGVGLRNHFSVELDDGKVSCRVEAVWGGHQGNFDVIGKFFEGVADVVEGYAGVEEEEPDYLTAAFGEEVEVVQFGAAADAIFGWAGLADFVVDGILGWD